jgi:hypothetical protein
VAWMAPSESVQATQLSTVPKHRSAGWRPSAAWASSHWILVADWFGASESPCSLLAVRHSPMVRRSCQPSAGAIGVPVARSHTIVEARWLAIPTPVTVGSPAPSRASRAAPRTASAIAAASNSTKPGNGDVGANGRYST